MAAKKYLLLFFLCIGCASSSYRPDQPMGYSRRDIRCMAEAIYGEARGEPKLGQIFVGRVILTRLKQGYAPNICKVVYARRQFAPKRNPNKASYRSAKKAFKYGANGVTHFHSYKRRRTAKAGFSVSKKCKYVYKIGNHWGFTCYRRGVASQ